MTLIYMKPEVQAECGICGDFTRRAQPWPYSESSGPDSVALMTPVGEECHGLIDQHTKYMKSGFPYFITEESLYHVASRYLILRHKLGSGVPDTDDLWTNTADYHVEIDGNICNFITTSADQRLFEDASATHRFQMLKNNPATKADIWTYDYTNKPDPLTLEFKLYKGAVLIDHSDFSGGNFDTNTPVAFGDLSVSTVFGGMFVDP